MLPAPDLPDDERRLCRLRALDLLDTPAEAAFDAFTHLASQVTGMPVALISLVDIDRQWFKSAVGLPQGGQTSRAVSFCGHAIAGDGIFEVENALTDPRFVDNPLVTGQPHVVHYAGMPLEMPGGERIGTICLISQQPGRLAAHERAFLSNLAPAIVQTLLLRENERKLQLRFQDRNAVLESVLENLPCGLALFDQDMRLVTRNAQLMALLDLPEHLLAAGTDFRSLTAFQACRGDLGEGNPQALTDQRVARAASPDGLHEKRSMANGTTLDIRSGKIKGGGQVQVYTDISREMRAASALRASEQRLAIALESVGLALWEYEPQADRVHLSESWSRLFGFKAQVGPVGLEQMAGLAPGHATRSCRRALLRLVRGDSGQMQLEHQMLNARGEAIWVITRAQVVERDAQGRASRVVGTTKDVTARHRNQADLKAAVQRADEANRAKAEFLATMSHEIRTPINGVIGLARMLADAQLPEPERGYVRMLTSCADSLLALVNDVLDFSKIEAGQVVIESIDCELPGLVREIGDVFRARALEKGLAFSVHLAPGLPQRVRTDPYRLRQILFNLLGNALKFTSTGEFSLRVDSVGEAQEPRLRLQVADSGIGISPQAQARLFQRYVQADNSISRRFQGTGLGLAIARELAVLMGGDITVNSTLGVGSIFTLDLPLVASARATPAPGTEALPAGSGREETALLLVEDNAINQLVARTLLTKLGFTDITIAGDGQEALEACRKRAFDLVLMDCQMPVMDGYQATRALRASGFDAPIIALTAGAIAQDREACLAAGMNDYLTKPIDIARLAELTDHWRQQALSVETT